MKSTPGKTGSSFSQQIGEQENQKLNAQHETKQGVWYGLGMFGMIGWSITVPVLLGTALGVWLDNHYPESFSWTITLLFSGLFLGCLTAWTWVSTEEKTMHQNKEKSDE
jgi:ATP synthase protein I